MNIEPFEDEQSNPIPPHLMPELDGYLSFIYDNDDMPDGAWFCALQSDCYAFMDLHKIEGDENDAVHQFLAWKAKQGGNQP